MKHYKKLNKSDLRRGFSIAEVVVSIAVITIVTFATLTIILSSNLITARSMKHQQAQLYAEDVINCFRAPSDSFEDSLRSVLDLDPNVTVAVNTDIKLDCGYILKYAIDVDTITVTILDESGSSAVVSLAYTKGGAQE